MSERDLKRIEVLTEVLAGRRSVESGAIVMVLAYRRYTGVCLAPGASQAEEGK